MKIGYARVSTEEQNLNRQIDILKQIGCDRIYEEKVSGIKKEREKTVSRINQGLDVARAKGKTLGRPKAELLSNFIKEYNKFKSGEYGNITASALAKMLGIGRSTLYKYIKLAEG